MIKYKILSIGILLLIVSMSMKTVDQKPVTESNVELIIRSNISQINPSENPNYYLKVDAKLINNGTKPIKFVLPGDGSQEGWRTPIIKWSVVKLDDKKSQNHKFNIRQEARCGNVNSVNEADIVTLEPTNEQPIDEWLGYPIIPKVKGKYGIKLSYENKPKIGWKGLGFYEKSILRKVKKTDYLSITSNEIIIEVLK